MTWDELVFRPLTADPFIYQGTGDADPVEEPGGGGVFSPYLRQMKEQSPDGRIDATQPGDLGGSLTWADPDNPSVIIARRSQGPPVIDDQEKREGYRSIASPYVEPTLRFPSRGQNLDEFEVPRPRCMRSLDPVTGNRRNLILYPPLACTVISPNGVPQTNRDMSILINRYREYRSRCFNKLVIRKPTSEHIWAALAAGYNINDLIIDVTCCSNEDCYDWVNRISKSPCRNPFYESVETLLKNAKKYIYCMQLGLPADCHFEDRNWDPPIAYDEIPGFYAYSMDEPIGSDSIKCKDPDTYVCGPNAIEDFKSYTQNLDRSYNGGTQTPLILGEWNLSNLSTLGSLGDGYSYTSYSTGGTFIGIRTGNLATWIYRQTGIGLFRSSEDQRTTISSMAERYIYSSSGLIRTFQEGQFDIFDAWLDYYRERIVSLQGRRLTDKRRDSYSGVSFIEWVKEFFKQLQQSGQAALIQHFQNELREMLRFGMQLREDSEYPSHLNAWSARPYNLVWIAADEDYTKNRDEYSLLFGHAVNKEFVSVAYFAGEFEWLSEAKFNEYKKNYRYGSVEYPCLEPHDNYEDYKNCVCVAFLRHLDDKFIPAAIGSGWLHET